MGIKNKTSLLVSLLFGVLLVAAAVLIVHLGEQEIRQTVITQQTALVSTLAYGFDEQVAARHKALIYVADHLPRDLLGDPGRLQAYLQDRVILYRLFTNVLVYDAEGAVLAAQPSPESYVGTRRLAQMEYVRRTIETARPYISKPFISPVSKEPLVVMTAPVLDADGKLLAILGGSQYVRRDNLFSGFTEKPVGRSGYKFIMTRDRVLVAHIDPSRVMEQIGAGINPGIDTALKEGSFSGETRNSRGVPVLMTAQTMQSTGWLAGAVMPLDEAYESVTALRRLTIQVVVILLVVLPALVWLATSFLTRPLLALRDQIKAMNAAPLGNARLAMDRADEIGDLAKAFDDLMTTRQVAEEKLNRLDREKRLAEAERLELLERLVQAQEQERLRLARELHDRMGQDLVGLSLGLKSLEPAVQEPHGRSTLQWLESLTAQIASNVHRTAWELRPTSLDDVGLVRALETYLADWSERFGIAVDFHSRCGDDTRFPPEVETTAYRVLQEALTNVLKHAAASTVSLVLERDDGWLRIILEDDGKGFDPDAAASQGRLGLAGMRERLALVGGTLTIDSVRGTGTTLYIRVPLPREAGKDEQAT
jgi:signal transduction histidine kinase